MGKAIQAHNENMVDATPLALEWLDRLKKIHGPLMLYQSGGCCEGSAPLCMKDGEFKLGDSDILMGYVGDVGWYISGTQFEAWKHTKLTLDVVKGGGNAFSLESPEGISFHVRSDLCAI